MPADCFVDSNILVYAHDRGAGDKHEVARDLVARLWRERAAALSTQVLQELYVNVRLTAARPVSTLDARRLVEDYMRWQLIVNDGQSILEALEVEARFQLSFWDALIVQAATASRARVLYSEDLGHDQSYGSVRVVNPFRS